MRNRVVITGLGCVTPVGNDPDTAWTNILAGKSGVSRITRFDSSGFKTQIAAEVKDFDVETLLGRREARRYDRVSHFALVAAEQAVQQANLQIDENNGDRVGVLIGTGIGGIITLYEGILNYLERGPSRTSPFIVPMMIPDSPSN